MRLQDNNLWVQCESFLKFGGQYHMQCEIMQTCGCNVQLRKSEFSFYILHFHFSYILYLEKNRFAKTNSSTFFLKNIHLNYRFICFIDKITVSETWAHS